MPASVLPVQRPLNQILQESRGGQPTLNLVADLGFFETAPGLGQVHRQSAQRLEHFTQTGGDALQLLTGESGGILQDAEIPLAVNDGAFGGSMDSRLVAATE